MMMGRNNPFDDDDDDASQGVPRTSKVFTKAPEGLTGSLGVLWFPRRWGLHGMSGGTRCASCTEFEGNVN